MAAVEMTMVFSYDVSRSKTRRRVAAILEDQAVRVQKSVFEARLGRAAAEQLFARLSLEVEDGDSLRMYALSASGLERCKNLGGAEIMNEDGFWLV